jgi:glycerate-2-kinase
LSLQTERWTRRFGRIFHALDDLVTNGPTPINMNDSRAIVII